MHWDLGLQGLAVLAAISLGFGVIAGLIVGKGVAYRLVATAITTVACFGVGLITSEVLFGWATEEELQPNVDGLSRDEVLLSSVLTTAVVVLAMRYLAHRAGEAGSHGDRPARHVNREAADPLSRGQR
jgi:short subunit fatty acids transporter